jgi:hypothetical protein
MTVWRVRITCWITNGTHTHTHTQEFAILIAVPLQQVARYITRTVQYSTLPVLAVDMFGCDRPVDVTSCFLLLSVPVVLLRQCQ